MAVSGFSEILSIVKAVSDYLYPYSSPVKKSTLKHQKRTQLRELCKNREDAVEEIEISTKLIDWFKSLDSSLRTKVLTHKNPTISAFLHEMHALNTHNGPHLFTLALPQPKLPLNISFASLFTSKKKSFNEIANSTHKLEEKFEKNLRFCDKDTYCDCISIDPDMPTEEFLQILRVLSEDKAFQVPCRISWNSSGNLWSWEYPKWFCPGNSYSMAAIACATIERAVWVQYWYAHGLDPRASGETMEYKKEEDSEYLVSELFQFFESVDQETKNQIVGDLDKHLEIHHQVKSFFEMNSFNFANAEKNANSLQMVKYDIDSLYFIIPHMSQSNKDIEAIWQNFASLDGKKFIEFLHFTKFERLGTNFDIVARKVLLSIITAFSDKKAEDLIKEAKVVAEPKPVKTSKKKRNFKKPLKNTKTSEKVLISSEMCKEIASSIVAELLSTIEKKAKSQVPNNQFPNQSISPVPPVKSQSTAGKGLAKTPQKIFQSKKPYKRPYSHRTAKPISHSASKVQSAKTSAEVTPTKPEQSSSKFQWSSHTSESKSSNLDNFEFPPLSSSHSAPVAFSLLHHEIIRFCSTSSKKVKEKYLRFAPSFQELVMVISKVHPDAYTAMYGSYGCGLALETSDIDLVVNLIVLPSRSQIQEACKKLCEVLEQSPLVVKCQAITTAKIPVIKVETQEYMIDITYEDENNSHQGMKAVEFAMNLLYMYPQLRELALVLKNLLLIKGLNSSYHGGLNSYSLLLWITASLNRMEYFEEDLGNLLMHFLNFYGNVFDPTMTGINIINCGSIHQLLYCCYESAVTIDPLSLQNITTNLYQIGELQRCFKETFEKLKELKDSPHAKNLLKQVFK